MSEQDRQLLDLLASINKIGQRCKHLRSSVAVPGTVYKLLDQLLAEISKWGLENIANSKQDQEDQK